ncbi:MAG TPA: hypothetical protein VMZ92_21615 [Planctomycetota bacterium]|nr:hypothetical protein [Planctomycetota bacterium]
MICEHPFSRERCQEPAEWTTTYGDDQKIALCDEHKRIYECLNTDPMEPFVWRRIEHGVFGRGEDPR